MAKPARSLQIAHPARRDGKWPIVAICSMNAITNDCLKPGASTLPLATDKIKKLRGFKYFIKAGAMHACWSTPLDEESKKLPCFQTHEGLFAWNRLTMGCRPPSYICIYKVHFPLPFFELVPRRNGVGRLRDAWLSFGLSMPPSHNTRGLTIFLSRCHRFQACRQKQIKR
jgi:hypothetical protein